MELLPLCFFFQNTITHLDKEKKKKKITQTPREGHIAIYLTSPPQTIKVIKNKESLRNCPVTPRRPDN